MQGLRMCLEYFKNVFLLLFRQTHTIQCNVNNINKASWEKCILIKITFWNWVSWSWLKKKFVYTSILLIIEQKNSTGCLTPKCDVYKFIMFHHCAIIGGLPKRSFYGFNKNWYNTRECHVRNSLRVIRFSGFNTQR